MSGLHDSERNKLLKYQRALLLASSDMTQAIAAARALQTEEDGTLSRVFETAMVISFMRPFTGSLKMPPGFYELPPGSHEERLYAEVKALRDKVYAHTDEGTGRQAGPIQIQSGTEMVNLSWNEAWAPLPRGELEFFIGVCEAIKEEMNLVAGKAQVILDGDLPIEQWGPLG